jgi:hypothetical protein
MSIPTWVTPAGTLGTIPEGVFYSLPLVATATETVYYKVIAGQLPPGVFIDETGILSGNPNAKARIEGIPLDVVRETTSTFAVRAYTEGVVNGVTVVTGLSDRTFSLTISNQSTVVWTTPAGTIGHYVDGVLVDLTLQYTDTSVYAVDVVTLIGGALPTGLSLSTAGVISGYITPVANTTNTETLYTFTLKVSNGINSDVRTFNMVVYTRALITADNTHITADNTYITADVFTAQPPIILTPLGSIGSTRSDNFYAFQFIGEDFAGNAFEFIATTDLPPGLTLDPNSGWLYGYIPYGGINYETYDFEILVRETENITNASQPYSFSLTITGPVNSDVVWLTPSDPVELARPVSSLGYIDNGSTSTFYVAAVNVSDIPLQYRLVSGSASRLPQGLQLLSSGHIAGRVSFDTFAVDGGTTVFDVGLNTVAQPTTFDMVATFTVNAYSLTGFVSVEKTFSITVVRRYQQPYDNLYIQAMPPENDRALINSLLQNPTIFPSNLIYRYDDPNFGIATRVVYNHAYGLTVATLENYVASLNLNHYWKNLTLGEIKTAQALDDSGNVLYEVVYSEVVDTLVNNDNISVGKEVGLPFPINVNNNQIDIVYPNSLQDMRNQVIDSVGQVSIVLPRWMLSLQPDGSVLGFTPAWVIAYTNPGASGQVAYNIQQLFGTQLNLIDFTADRYEVDGFLTKNWLPTDTISINNISGPATGNIFTVEYDTQYTSRFAVNEPITISNVIPSVYNGAYNVSLCTANSVQFQSNSLALSSPTYTSGGNVSSKGTWATFEPVDILSVVGNGSVVTVEFNTQPIATPFAVGSDINLINVVPPIYNGTYTVTSSNNQAVTFNSAISDAYVCGGAIVSQNYSGYANATPSLTRFDVAAPPLNTLASWDNNANVITTWEDNLQTLATWTYATPGVNNQGTTFDNNSLLFTSPVDMYSSTNTTDYDKYLLFPKRDIIQNLPQINQVFWVNDYSEFVEWVNNLNEPVIWTTENA